MSILRTDRNNIIHNFLCENESRLVILDQRHNNLYILIQKLVDHTILYTVGTRQNQFCSTFAVISLVRNGEY